MYFVFERRPLGEENVLPSMTNRAAAVLRTTAANENMTTKSVCIAVTLHPATDQDLPTFR
jgi:hypothetical protein